jgi:hypothetical protein
LGDMGNKIVTRVSDKSSKKTKYIIEKELSINNVEQVKKELDEVLAKNDDITLELKNIENFDLTAIQLIHVLKEKLNDKFSYTIEMKDDLKTIITHSGFDNLLSL